MSRHSRRRFLELAGAGTAVALAGCSAGDTGANPTTGDAGTTTTDTDETETTDTETTADDTETTMSTVFHFSGGEQVQGHAMANVANLLGDDSTPVEDVALVANGAGVKLVTTDSTVAERVRSLAEQGVRFAACRNSMDAFDYADGDLLSGVETVPAGVGELTKLQTDGYAYVKTP
ncbi:DsrE family protein [Halomicrococcus gelatinilyticus]|uniref:DsrE family protein n=1 Tax=Halomicrococcus gelatinilyticus TaxID=1702103 RepID=UPI002E13EA94